MIRSIILPLLSCTYLSASTPSPIDMASDLNLSANQIKQLQQIDTTIEQVKRHSHAKQIEVLNPEQRKLFFARYKTICTND
jgi:hypothetical protein